MSFLFHCPDIIHNIYIDILNTMGPTYVMMEYLEKKLNTSSPTSVMMEFLEKKLRQDSIWLLLSCQG